MRRFLVIICFLVLIFVPRVYAQEPQKGLFSKHLLSLFNSLTPSSAPLPSPTPIIVSQPPLTITPIPLPTPIKSSYKIAVYGDSMVDTMGEVLEYLEHSLKKRYPATQFTLYNYGQGSQNVEDGLNRFYNDFNYKDRHYSSLLTVRPDILIVGSFAYNPFSPNDPERYKVQYRKLLLQARNVATDVYVLSEIAPLRNDFGKGPGGVNWDVQTSYEHSQYIIQGLENAQIVANQLDIPIINAYQPSITNHLTKEGNKSYVNPSDGIHPSVLGHEFTADLITSAIRLQ